MHKNTQKPIDIQKFSFRILIVLLVALSFAALNYFIMNDNIALANENQEATNIEATQQSIDKNIENTENFIIGEDETKYGTTSSANGPSKRQSWAFGYLSFSEGDKNIS